MGLKLKCEEGFECMLQGNPVEAKCVPVFGEFKETKMTTSTPMPLQPEAQSPIALEQPRPVFGSPVVQESPVVVQKPINSMPVVPNKPVAVQIDPITRKNNGIFNQQQIVKFMPHLLPEGFHLAIAVKPNQADGVQFQPVQPIQPIQHTAQNQQQQSIPNVIELQPQHPMPSLNFNFTVHNVPNSLFEHMIKPISITKCNVINLKLNNSIEC